MTQYDPIEALRNLTSHKAAAEAEQTRNRSRDRSPIVAATGFVAGITPATMTNNFGTRSGINLQLDNLQDIKVAPGSDPVQLGSSRQIFIPVPDKPNINSEVAQMAGSAAACNSTVDSILDLRGHTITFDERVHTFKGRRNTKQQDAEGKDIWEESTFNVYYYHITKIAGAGVQPEAAAQPTPDTMAKVALYVTKALDAGIDLKTADLGSVVADLKSQGVDLTEKQNAGIQSALVAGTLAEYVGFKEVVKA